MRNGFREGLVTGLKKRVYHGKKAGRRAYHRARLEEEMLRLQDVGKQAAQKRAHQKERDQEVVHWG